MIPEIADSLREAVRMSLKEVIDEVVKALKDKTGEIVLALIIATLTYIWTLAKKRFQQGNARDRQVFLSLEANRLVKLRETLARATDPSPNVTKAQAAIGSQLNHVLENLSHLLAEPEASISHSPFVAAVGKYLLLYRAPGFISVFMHAVFYLLVPCWMLIVYAAFQGNSDDKGITFFVCALFLTPVILWNYLTRKVDAWVRARRALATSK